jgi:hypothetical protein
LSQRYRREGIAVGIAASSESLALGRSAIVKVHKIAALVIDVSTNVIGSISGTCEL